MTFYLLFLLFVPVGARDGNVDSRQLYGPVLPAHDGGGASQNFRRHQDVHRVSSEARVREGTAGATAAQRYTRLHRR